MHVLAALHEFLCANEHTYEKYCEFYYDPGAHGRKEAHSLDEDTFDEFTALDLRKIVVGVSEDMELDGGSLVRTANVVSEAIRSGYEIVTWHGEEHGDGGETLIVGIRPQDLARLLKASRVPPIQRVKIAQEKQ